MQNKFQDLQSKLQSTVQGLNANISDGATRLKQQIVQNAQQTSLLSPQSSNGRSQDGQAVPTSPTEQQPAQFLRLPIESAKKLRWFDQHDMKMLIQLHLREKHELYQANAALREALRRHGPKTSREIELIEAEVDAFKLQDVGINDVLVLSAQAEIERLQDEVANLGAKLRPAESSRTAENTPQKADRKEAHPDDDTPGEGPSDEGSTSMDNALESSPAAPAAPAGEEEGSCARCIQFEQQASRLSGQLAFVQQEADAAGATAQTQLEKAKARFAAAQKSQEALLKMAQDGRLEAEERAMKDHQRLAQLQKNIDTLTAETKRLKAEAESAGVRAVKAETELGRLTTESAAKANANVSQAASVARARVAELESSSAALNLLVASLQAQVASLEKRLAAAEAEAARASADAQELEAAASERDSLSMRLATAEARLQEIRASSLSSSGMREMLEQSEARRMEAEEELVATAKLAASLEERLARVTAAAEDSVVQAHQAEVKVTAAQASVAGEVARRWDSAGGDRSQWPPKALDEIEAVEARLAALQAAHKGAQERLEAVSAELQAAEAESKSADSKVAAAGAALERLQRSTEQRERRLEAAALAAARQVDEFRAALARLERERDALADEKRIRESASKAATAAVAAATLRAGNGGISDRAEMMPSSFRSRSNSLEVGSLPIANRGVDSTDLIYLKNVLLKFLKAYLEGKYQECEVLLPAVSAVLRASPAEFKAIKDALAVGTSALGWLYSASQTSS